MLHAVRWPALMVVIAVLALLWTFDRVVREGVQQGVLRRAADLQRSNAVWRCNALAEKQARTDCRLAAL